MSDTKRAGARPALPSFVIRLDQKDIDTPKETVSKSPPPSKLLSP
jgi:hypothetical protein